MILQQTVLRKVGCFLLSWFQTLVCECINAETKQRCYFFYVFWLANGCQNEKDIFELWICTKKTN